MSLSFSASITCEDIEGGALYNSSVVVIFFPLGLTPSQPLMKKVILNAIKLNSILVVLYSFNTMLFPLICNDFFN